MDGERPSPFSFLGRRLGRAFELRVIAIAPGHSRAYEEAEWRDAIVVVERGELELECTRGGRRNFGRGETLLLAGLPLRALHNPGREPVLLAAVSRRSRRSADSPATETSDGPTPAPEADDVDGRGPPGRFPGPGAAAIAARTADPRCSRTDQLKIATRRAMISGPLRSHEFVYTPHAEPGRPAISQLPVPDRGGRRRTP